MHSSIPDKNIPGADNAMTKARKMIKYFSKSTQQTAKLLDFQSNGTIPIVRKGIVPRSYSKIASQGGGQHIECSSA